MEPRELDLSSRGMEFVNTPSLSSASLRSTASLSVSTHMIYDLAWKTIAKMCLNRKICSHNVGMHYKFPNLRYYRKF